MENKIYTTYPKINGVYCHYKGGMYKVLTLATHTETQEPMVVYQSLLFGSIYVRPLSMWFDIKEDSQGYKTTRFKLVD